MPGPEVASIDLNWYKSLQFNIKTARITSSKNLSWHYMNQVDWSQGLVRGSGWGTFPPERFLYSLQIMSNAGLQDSSKS